jgi:hypothetical protein
MTDWCIAHPWMTFFICLALVPSIRITIPWRRKSRTIVVYGDSFARESPRAARLAAERAVDKATKPPEDK